jgi:hypothetical protein
VSNQLKIFYLVYFIIGIASNCNGKYLDQVVHVFGDSHSSYLFSNQQQGKIYLERSHYQFQYLNETVNLPFVIHWLGPITMYRIGRDGISCEEIKDDDIVVFVSGEIDVRCHIGKQRDQYRRALEEVIETLVKNYIAAILKLRAAYNKLTCVISMIVPPTDVTYNPEFPYYGSLDDRINITRMLNKTLERECNINNILFIDKYNEYCTERGDLRPDISESGNVHVVFHKPMKEKLLELVLAHLKI